MAVARRRRRDEDEEPDEGSSRRRATSADKYKADDDDEDETPRASRRRERESTRDEDDDRPRRSRRDEDDDEDERPRSRKRSRDEDDDEDERPRSRRSSRDDDEDEDERPRSRKRSRDDDEDEPRGGRRRRARDDDEDEADEPETRAGFAGFRKAREAAGNLGDRFKVPEEAMLIKFMDDEPVHNYNVHWINRRPWVCIENDCPLCEAGHTAQSVGIMNVVPITGKKPTVQVWEAGPQAVTAFEKKGNARSGPLTRQYYSVERYKEGGNGPWKLDLQVVRESEVVDDWNLEPLTDDDLDRLEKQCKGKEYVKYPTRKELREVAKTLDD